MKAARNDPCPCGSGRKYKHCHGAPSRARLSPEESVWRRLRTALDDFPSRILGFIHTVYGADAVNEAWREFALWEYDELEFDPESPHLPVFLPWFFHRWTPDPVDSSIEDLSLHARAPTSVFLERRGRQVDPLLRRYLEACLASPFSFHEVLRADPGRGFLARDVFVGDEREVLERSASGALRAGDILFGQLVTTDGITLIEASAPHVIPPAGKIDLVELREQIAGGSGEVHRELLADWEIELRDEYWHAIEKLLDPSPPRLQNTDGDALEFQRLYFDIDTPQAAFDALKQLAFDEMEAELLESAERDAQGALVRVSFDWKAPGNRVHQSWENTILGRIEIDGDRLVAEVNSAERAERLRQIIEASLGDHARYRMTEGESVEEALAKHRAREGPYMEPEEPDLANHPEVRERLREMMVAHYDDWVSQPLPALGGLTPLEAVKDKAGREKVEALITQMGRDGEGMNPALDERIFRSVRERLGLA